MGTMSWLAEYIDSASMTFIGALISAIAGLLLSREDQRAKNLLIGLVCLGALVTAFGGWWASYEQDKTNSVLLEKTNEISALNKKLAEKSDELAATLHGGESFVYLDPHFMSRSAPKEDLVEIDIHHTGRYPVYEIEIRVVDLRKSRQIDAENQRLNRDPTLEQMAQTEIHYSFRNNAYLQRFDPNRRLGRLDIWQLPKDADQQDYNVWILARNGEVVQQIRFRRINGEWKRQIRVTRGTTVLYDDTWHGADYLPRNEAGEVQWE